MCDTYDTRVHGGEANVCVKHLSNCRKRCRNEPVSDDLDTNIENLKECNEKDVNREFNDEVGDDCSCNAELQTFNVGTKGSLSKISKAPHSEEPASEEIKHGKAHTFKEYEVILSDNAKSIRDRFRSNPEEAQSNRIAFHGTGKDELESVLTNGFWYANTANYGPGVYFTSKFTHAEAYVHHHMDNIGLLSKRNLNCAPNGVCYSCMRSGIDLPYSCISGRGTNKTYVVAYKSNGFKQVQRQRLRQIRLHFLIVFFSFVLRVLHYKSFRKLLHPHHQPKQPHSLYFHTSSQHLLREKTTHTSLVFNVLHRLCKKRRKGKNLDSIHLLTRRGKRYSITHYHSNAEFESRRDR